MIFFTSDTHFCHKNIIEFCKRPFQDSISMNKYMIDSWNNIVSPEDEVYHLGDFFFGSTKTARYILNSLNGKKFIIKGNHDREKYLNNFKNSNLIEWWKYSHTLDYEYENQLYTLHLSHYPHYPIYNDKLICLHGHVHTPHAHRGEPLKKDRVLDVGVDNMQFKPISIIDVIKLNFIF